MKKIFALILALAMVLALAACGSNGASSNGGAANSGSAASSAEGNGYNLATPGVLTMGTNATFPPYEFYEGEEIVGIDAEIAAKIAEKLGLELQIVDMDFGALVGAVQAGKIDVCLAGMTVTEDRLENVNFSTSYATGIQVIIVAEGSSITSDADLYTMLENGDDFLIGCQESTTGYIYCAAPVEEYGFGEEHVIAYPNGATAVQALMQGKVDCVIIDNQPAQAYVAANEGLVILDTEYVTEDYAIAIAKENTTLQADIDAALNEMIADGTVQAILDKYITD